jgi:copper homeostasis protein (lipoprotein)
MKKINLTLLRVGSLLFFTTLIGFMGCSPKIKTTETLSKGDNSMVSLDWYGTYMGKIPCADCQGIETSITLNKDGSYLLKTKYLGKSDVLNEKTGKYTWNTAGSTITLNGISNSPNQFLVGENVLFQLDMSGKRITGNLAESYQLKKIN